MTKLIPKKIPNKTWQVTCRLVSDEDFAEELLYEVFVSLGISLVDIVQQVRRNQREMVCFSSTLNQARKLQSTIRSLKLKGVIVSLKVLHKKDWQDLWKKGIKPFALTANIDIVPRWTSAQYQKTNKFPVYIDTNLAFGTGLHETTRFMAQLIELRRGDFISFLDVGTGSGILAIIAHHWGAKKIIAIDIDQQSMAVAQANFKANRVEKVKLQCADVQTWRNKTQYDFVAANLVTDDLLNFGTRLVALVKPQKFLAVSGISLKNLPRLIKAFGELPLKKIKVIRGQQWSAVLYQRKD